MRRLWQLRECFREERCFEEVLWAVLRYFCDASRVAVGKGVWDGKGATSDVCGRRGV